MNLAVHLIQLHIRGNGSDESSKDLSRDDFRPPKLSMTFKLNPLDEEKKRKRTLAVSGVCSSATCIRALTAPQILRTYLIQRIVPVPNSVPHREILGDKFNNNIENQALSLPAARSTVLTVGGNSTWGCGTADHWAKQKISCLLRSSKCRLLGLSVVRGHAQKGEPIAEIKSEIPFSQAIVERPMDFFLDLYYVFEGEPSRGSWPGV
jgi:hypothetical protein